MTDTMTLTLILAGLAVLVCVVQVALAVMHDRAATAAGPVQALDILNERIALKRQDEAVIDAAIAERKKQVENVADIEARAEAAARRLAELEAEWSSMAERRQELDALRVQVDEKFSEKSSLESDIAEAVEKLEAHREKLLKIDQIDQRLEAGRAELAEMAQQLAEDRETARRLEEAEARLATAEAKAGEAETRRARAAEDVEAREHRLAELDADLQVKNADRATLEAELATLRAERAALKDTLAEKTELEASVAALREEERRLRDVQLDLFNLEASLPELDQKRKAAETLRNEVETLEDQRDRLQARIAALQEEERRSGGGEGLDPLRDLHEPPAALTALRGGPERAPANEEDELERLAGRIKGQGLIYPRRVLHAFHTAMKVNETTQMAVLAGISGTGKSQLPRQYALGMGIGLLQVPVQPRWDSPQDLMGFYNYIEGRYRPTDLARALWSMDAANNPDAEFRENMLLVLLDEMNLARVEYYFSDFLSRLESRPALGLVGDMAQRKDAEIELEIVMKDGKAPPRIFPGYNLLFAGTMNEDESTQSLSDKVVDRANVLRFPAPEGRVPRGVAEAAPPQVGAMQRSRWQGWIRHGLDRRDAERTDEVIEKLAAIMRDLNRPFGHRLARSIRHYVANYVPVQGAHAVQDALADQVEMRLLPKLRGVEIEQTRSPFEDLQRLIEQQLQDERLADAIRTSVERSADDAAGRFVWSGVSRL